ncbi:MAG: two-component system response regulator [Candidatus Omnitrophica bacterium CG07_land_8_20_14_0_80_42_15]|uniref:Two-component system response regulator n=1 Tax=Candidatus Aquitaenariimonas noxiae TaxID=1974741 RepID=A0A2J0KZ88_9BACT|nr:MAG: two-component system response regulator [Candidatus Omnitrophica bacterium CG07_land_8_20_14_0_80_42_15]
MQNKKNDKIICKILTVDDELGIDSFFYEFFTLRNFKVFTAASGKKAIKIAQRERPKIVLLDINMRGMDGMEALEKIKAIDKGIVVIMVTGVKDDDIMKKALSKGADDYITKPLSLEYLEKVVLAKFLERELEDIKKIDEEIAKKIR